jgi:hypothetical protein
MPEPSIQQRYGLTGDELLGTVDLRPRFKAVIERSVAATHMTNLLASLVGSSISRFEALNRHGSMYWLIWLNGRDEPIRARCKIAFRRRTSTVNGPSKITYHVSAHDSGNALEFPENRLYGAEHFQILGVCLGRITSNWTDFLFARTIDLARHSDFPHKLAALHQLPSPSIRAVKPWYKDITELFSDTTTWP